MAIDPLLSPLIRVAFSWEKPNSPCNIHNQQAFLAASNNAIYLASIKDRAVIVCFFNPYVMAPPCARNTYSVVDLQLSKLAKATLAYPTKEYGSAGASL